MNTLVLPPPANWFECNTIACAPDNTVVYASRNDLIVVHPKPPEEPADVDILYRHNDRVLGVCLNLNWGNTDKLAVLVGGDKAVVLYDVVLGKVKSSHSGHTTRSDRLVGATFAGYDRVISVSEDGFIIIWKWDTNQLNSLSDLLGSKVKVSCISACPHASWLAAFGLKRGEIIVTDLRKTGRILYKLRGHDSQVLTLSWCPTPFNILPKISKTVIKIVKDKKLTSAEKIETLEIPVVESVTSEDKDEVQEDTCQIKVIDKTVNLTGEEVLNDPCQIKEADETVNQTTEEVENDPCQIKETDETVNLTDEEVLNDPCQIKEADETVDQTTEEVENDTCQIKEIDKTESTEHAVEIELVAECSEAKEVPEYHQNEEDKSSEAAGDELKVETEVVIAEEMELDGCSKPDVETAISDSTPIEVEPENNQTSLESTAASEILTKEYLLASSARGGRTISIWRAGTDGIKQVELTLPNHKSRHNQRHSQNDEKPWITLCWISSRVLLSSSPKGELLSWDLGTSPHKFRLVHHDHSRHLFGIAAPIKFEYTTQQDNWRDREALNAWTIGKDRLLLNTSLSAERKALALYPTIAGSISCLASSPTYPNKIAIGAAEGICRIWDLSIPHTQFIVMKNFQDKTHQKIVRVAFHPSDENLLAYGTVDGRIGLLDPNNNSKQPVFLIQYANSSVHRMEWGPLYGDAANYVLYVVINEKLIYYDIATPLNAANILEMCKKVTQISWKPDYTICAVGSKDGHVSLFSPDFKLITTLYQQNKSVRWISWHPEATVEDDGVSPYASWLAVATNDVTIYNCDNTFKNETEDYANKVVAVFTDHSKVQCLSWSTHEGGKLASVSEEGTTLVWNVKTKTLTHSCIKSIEIFNTVLWSPLDPDYIITGSKGSIIQIWKLSENPLCEFKARKPHKSTKPKESDNVIEEIEKSKKTKKYVFGGVVEAYNRNDIKSLLKECKRLFEVQYKKVTEDEGNCKERMFDMLKVFGNGDDLEHIYNTEKEFNSKRKQAAATSHIALWQGDMGNAIRKAMQMKTLNPWLISMAPSVSHKLYLEVCESYADNLSEEPTTNPYEIVSYYLVCHQLEKAIETLMSSHCYLEAYILAKQRLGNADPFLNKIVQRWGDFCLSTGAFEIAAHCYLVVGQLDSAAKALFRRSERSALSLCAAIAEHCDNKNLLEATLYRMQNIDGEKHNEHEEPEIPLLTRAELEISIKRRLENSTVSEEDETPVTQPGTSNIETAISISLDPIDHNYCIIGDVQLKECIACPNTSSDPSGEPQVINVSLDDA